MTGVISDKAYLIGVGRVLGAHLIEMRADHPHEVDILGLVFAADVIAAAQLSAFQHGNQRIRAIFHIEPITDVFAFAVNGDVLARQRI